MYNSSDNLEKTQQELDIMNDRSDEPQWTHQEPAEAIVGNRTPVEAIAGERTLAEVIPKG